MRKTHFNFVLFKGVIKWFNDNLIKPMKDKLDAISWDSIKTKAEEAWTAIKTKTDEVLGALWDLLPAMPEALTWDYYFGEGGVFDWDLDWDSWFDFDLPDELTYDHYFGEGGVFDWDFDWECWIVTGKHLQNKIQNNLTWKQTK